MFQGHDDSQPPPRNLRPLPRRRPGRRRPLRGLRRPARFRPRPAPHNRADGWDSEVQRAYIAALSLTGADRSACRAVGKSAFGVTQLIAHEGSESFCAAREEALAMAADERSRRLAEGLRAVAAEK